MTTSGVRDTPVIVTSMITQSLRKLQVGVGGETLADEYLAIGIDAFNTLIGRWAVKDICLWLNETQSVTLTSGVSSYTLSPRVLEIYQAVRRSGTNDVPMRIITREEYSRLPNKTSGGTPTQVWFDRQISSVVANVWPVPGAAEVAAGMTLRPDVKRQIEDITAGAETIEFPPEWRSALIWNGAIEMAPDFGKDPSQTVVAMAQQAYSDLEGQDREGSVYMRPRRF